MQLPQAVAHKPKTTIMASDDSDDGYFVTPTRRYRIAAAACMGFVLCVGMIVLAIMQPSCGYRFARPCPWWRSSDAMATVICLSYVGAVACAVFGIVAGCCARTKDEEAQELVHRRLAAKVAAERQAMIEQRADELEQEAAARRRKPVSAAAK
jgi:hypothetical protein